MECLSVVSVLCYQVEVCASGWPLTAECVVSEYDREAWIIRRLWPVRCCRVVEKIQVRLGR
jgi:hypothetical protein